MAKTQEVSEKTPNTNASEFQNQGSEVNQSDSRIEQTDNSIALTNPSTEISAKVSNNDSTGEEKRNWLEALSPEPISSIIKLMFNLLMGLILILLIYGITSAIHQDIQKKESEERQKHSINAEQCRRDYIDNRCAPEVRAPALEDYCIEKEKCFMRDPSTSVRSSHMTAELVAQILNGFIEHLEIKAMIFLFLLTFGMIFTCNCSLRNRPLKQNSNDAQVLKTLKELSTRFESLNKDVQIISKEIKKDKNL